MSQEITPSIPVYIKYKDGKIISHEDIWPVADVADTIFAGHVQKVSDSSSENPGITHYVALPTSADKGNIELAKFDGKPTKVTTNEAPFVYKACGNCSAPPPKAQGLESAVSCPHCSQTIVGEQIARKLIDQKVLLIKPKFDPIDPDHSNLNRHEILEQNAEIVAKNDRAGMGCASWLGVLTILAGGSILTQNILTNVASKLSDITYIYNNDGYYIPSDLLKDSISTANIICLAPLVLAGLATIIRFGTKMQSPKDESIIRLLKFLPDEIDEVNIWELSEDQYNDPTTMVHIREK